MHHCLLICGLILILTSILALYSCPHSKVEESFNLQATHDLFYHGVGPAWKSLDVASLLWGGDINTCIEANKEQLTGQCVLSKSLPYDHIRYPGVVPRTFFGAFVLSFIAKVLALAIPKELFDLASHPMHVQFLIRLELLLLSWLAHFRLAKALEGYFMRLPSSKQKRKHPKMEANYQHGMPLFAGKMIGSYYLLITASQFHIPFYSSRLLPNTFALLLTTNAYAEWFHGHFHLTAMYLVFTTAIFRCDMLLLLFSIGLSMLMKNQLTVIDAIRTGIITGVLSILVTVPLDSLLWGRHIWPEFEVWWFNTVQNRSGEWGKMVWHWYFSRALPKGMLFTALLIPFAFLRLPEFADLYSSAAIKNVAKRRKLSSIVDTSLFAFFVPILLFVALYSFLPHKEIRFIFPAFPIFNVCAAYGMSRLHSVAFPDRLHSLKEEKKTKVRWAGIGIFICGLVTIALTMVGSLIFLRISMENYPGGVALERLRHYLEGTIAHPSISVAHSQSNNKESKWEMHKWNDVRVHIDVGAAMSGISLFGQRHASVRFVLHDDGKEKEEHFEISKSGYEENNQLDHILAGNSTMYIFTHLLTEKPEVEGYQVIDVVHGHPQLDVRNLQMTTKEAIYILENVAWKGT